MRQQLFDTAAYAHRGGPAPTPLMDAPGRLFDTAPFAARRPATAESVSSVMGGTQHKMFMTPTEIHAGWQPLDGDREESGDWGESTGSWDLTGRSRNDAGDMNTFRTYAEGGAPQYKRATSGVESDEDLWSRKLDEAHEYGVHGQYGEDSASEGRSQDPLFKGGAGGGTMGSYEGGPTGGWTNPSDSQWDRHYERADSWEQKRQDARSGSGESLADSVRNEGVRGPIRLGSQIGSMGKPQIVGGHHRLAAATAYGSDKLVPVLHDWSIHSARDEAKRGGYPYA